MNRFAWLGLGVLIVVALWTTAWFTAAGLITATVKGFEATDGVGAPRLSCEQFSIHGFPFGFDLTCTGATIVDADTTITAAGLQASAEIYDPFHILAFAKSPIGIADAFTGSASRLDFSTVTLSARLNGLRIAHMAVELDDAVLNDTVLEDRLIGKASHVELVLQDIPDQHDVAKHLAALAQYGLVEGLELPGLGITGGTANLKGYTSGLTDDIQTYRDPGALQRWQQAGGKFNLASFSGEDALGHFDSSGTLGLDDQGRLEGQIRIVSTGVVERIGPNLAEPWRSLMLGAPAADGSYSQTINIGAGVISAGLVPAGMIAPFY